MLKKHSYNLTLSSLKNAWQLILNGDFQIFFKELTNRIYSTSLSFGLKRDLEAEFESPSARVDLSIRPLKEVDVPDLLENTAKNPVDPRLIARQKAMVDAEIPTCYVALANHEKPCYMQWLIGYQHREKVSEFFKGIFPTLKDSEALLEGAYANPDFSGLRIMPAAMAEIAKKAESLNVRWVITFVDVNNIPSLKGCHRSGFEPYILRKSRMFFFRHTVSFHPVPEKLLKIYNQQMGVKKEIFSQKTYQHRNAITIEL